MEYITVNSLMEKKNGKGEIIFDNKCYYTGSFKDDFYEGEGIFFFGQIEEDRENIIKVLNQIKLNLNNNLKYIPACDIYQGEF